MAGSQLKQLKEALKAKGLVGQTNVKRKNKKNAPSETRKDQEEKRKEISKIRDEFNKFDQRINRSKHDFTVISGGKFVKAGSKQHNDSSKTHSSVEKAMRLDYDAEKKVKNRVGGVIDRRFGESNRHMTQEEKMLQRFTRERQSSSKKNVFSLGSEDEYDDDDADGGFALTHSGKKLAFADNDTLADEGLGAASEKRFVDEDSLTDQPARKKSKKEVMAEVIAKSKFYKRQRQAAFEKAQDEIMDLDDDFADVMGEIHSQRKSNQSMTAKSKQDIDYDAKVRELTYDRRAVPADRTKTDEEIAKEHTDKMKKLEEDRMKRMTGLQDQGEQDADDLGDEFWAGSGDEAEGVAINDGSEAEDHGSSDGSESEGAEDDGPYARRLKKASAPPVSMPGSHVELASQTQDMDTQQTLAHVKKILALYDPRLAQGNKEKTDVFVGILFEHILAVGNQPDAPSQMVDSLTHLLRTLAERYNEALVEVIRATMAEVEERVVKAQLQKKDIVFFVVLGYVFSTSDHYHLVVTPALILLNQYLSACIGVRDDLTVQQLGQGVLVCEILLSYQSFAKRFDPEVVKFLERCLVSLLPVQAPIEGTLSGGDCKSRLKLSKTYKPEPLEDTPIRVQALFESPTDEALLKFQLIGKALALMDQCVGLWKEKSACIELLRSFNAIMKVAARFYSGQLPRLGEMMARYSKLLGNQVQSRRPLTLQEHKKMSIKTFAPKFEENFNPDKKSYDINRERQELNKVKAQVKKETKLALKDIRKQTKFVARQQIEEKKEMYSDYHRKMANIVNSISTVEGAEKNQYEREKKKRQNQR
ncbi:Nop14-like protein [Metschnikowia bicuspidata var. bicuspidata NRRL YB-4993]|uniref:Nop14-like protein n=1 Tax=Metschnikowia bicuspidata var. bicuspidata NRRL YB-4993 TaxID=869754 RepID=A0A1A0HKB9_9ASCO|nr:Nop14-like protein [Metschnikowia bicuspidata var. bicuspidata NRRL YB-4993]OBA24248.1 Nop14-like protein [Metschnikowia bicuspidata var. bicuspidata NRRL YB-4993]